MFLLTQASQETNSRDISESDLHLLSRTKGTAGPKSFLSSSGWQLIFRNVHATGSFACVHCTEQQSLTRSEWDISNQS